MLSFNRLIFGGIYVVATSAYTDDNIMYDITWVDKKDMPVPVSDATASVVNGRVYIIGGCDAVWGNSWDADADMHTCKEIADHVMIYNPLEDSWAVTASPMQFSRYRHASVVVGTDIYVIGGRDVDDAILKSVLKYSTTTDTWTLINEFAEATSDNAAFEHDGKIITCGGYPSNYSKASAACHIMDVSAPSPKFEPWTSSLATGRGDFSIVKLDGLVYAFGGFGDYTSGFVALKSIENIDPSQVNAGIWVPLAGEMQRGRGDFAAGKAHGRLMAIGGEDSDLTDGSASLRQVEAFNPTTGKWLGKDKMEAIPHATFRFCGATVGEGIYIFGGQGPKDADCNCYPTKAGVFVYNENLTSLEGNETAGAWRKGVALAALSLIAALH